MKTSDQAKFEFWRNHYEQSKLYPDGIQAYCDANKLAISVYYKWRQRILNLKSSKTILKKVKSPFLPVVAAPTELKIPSYPQQRLPDSRWVAEIITNVIRGLL
jgi:hypothetical protein